ncbi:hypothetical protein C2845_PM02G39310 [Panicum miliaceum]|uniref:Uncharacterized protein n=1 Tax=Panicum miliaceum TaxID=4540 RepID=A0A3L6S848_PANMI|nr:hypothetical protein C2845_PM02G39310 [Panicum miliaceum]
MWPSETKKTTPRTVLLAVPMVLASIRFLVLLILCHSFGPTSSHQLSSAETNWLQASSFGRAHWAPIAHTRAIQNEHLSPCSDGNRPIRARARGPVRPAPCAHRASCVDQKRSEILLGAPSPQASSLRFPHIRSGHHPRRRPPWPRPCPPSPSRSLAAQLPPLPWPPPAVPGPRRCAGGIAPSRPSPQPAALRRRGSSTTRRKAPGGGRCLWPVPPRPPRLFPGPIRRHSQQSLRKGSCLSSTRRLVTPSSTRSGGRKWPCKGKIRCTKM